MTFCLFFSYHVVYDFDSTIELYRLITFAGLTRKAGIMMGSAEQQEYQFCFLHILQATTPAHTLLYPGGQQKMRC